MRRGLVVDSGVGFEASYVDLGFGWLGFDGLAEDDF